jgi:histidinol-phosphate aminotransferase
MISFKNNNKFIYRTLWNSKARNKSKLWLDKNENTDIFLRKIYLNILKKINFYDICAYPDLTETYKKVSKFLKVDKDQIYLTAGSDLAIKSIFESFISSGDKVLLTKPTYAMYSIYCQLFNVKKISINYEFSKNSPYLNIRKLINAIKKHRPRLICLPNPDSPTGQIINNENMQQVLHVAKKNNSLVLIDEAYYLFYKNSFINYIKNFDNLIITRSGSKAMALAGLRIGIVISNSRLASKIFIHKPMYEISSISSFFLKEIIKPNNYKLINNSVNRLLEGKKFFINYLRKTNIKYFDSYANFIHVDFGKLKKSIIKKLYKYVYFRTEESHPSLKGYSRISITTKDKFKFIIKIINEFYK